MKNISDTNWRIQTGFQGCRRTSHIKRPFFQKNAKLTSYETCLKTAAETNPASQTQQKTFFQSQSMADLLTIRGSKKKLEVIGGPQVLRSPRCCSIDKKDEKVVQYFQPLRQGGGLSSRRQIWQEKPNTDINFLFQGGNYLNSDLAVSNNY